MAGSCDVVPSASHLLIKQLDNLGGSAAMHASGMPNGNGGLPLAPQSCAARLCEGRVCAPQHLKAGALPFPFLRSAA